MPPQMIQEHKFRQGKNYIIYFRLLQRLTIWEQHAYGSRLDPHNLTSSFLFINSKFPSAMLIHQFSDGY